MAGGCPLTRSRRRPEEEAGRQPAMKGLLRWRPGLLGSAILVAPCFAAELAPSGEAAVSPEEKAYYKALESLHWVRGPAVVDVPGKSKLVVPENYLFLDIA